MLQKVMRRFVHRVGDRQMRIERILNENALVIQRTYRGRIDRELCKRLKKNRIFHERYIPAVILIQKHIRRCNCQRKFLVVRERHRAAVSIQKIFRRILRRRIIIQKWFDILELNKGAKAAQIQKRIRGVLARARFARMQLVRKGRITQAARVILRAWVNFKQAKRLQFLLDKHRVDLLTDKITRLQSVREGIQEDRAEIMEDVEFSKAAAQQCREIIRKNEVFAVEVQLRLPRIKVTTYFSGC
jgi:hypothetical protein